MTHFLASFVKAAFLRTWQTLRSGMLAGRPCHVTSRVLLPTPILGLPATTLVITNVAFTRTCTPLTINSCLGRSGGGLPGHVLS